MLALQKISSYISYRVWGFTPCACLDYMLYTSCCILHAPCTCTTYDNVLASESAEEEVTRLSRRQSRDRARRAAQSSQATKFVAATKFSAEARERTDRDRRKRRLGSESAKEKDTRLSSETQSAYTNSV